MLINDHDHLVRDHIMQKILPTKMTTEMFDKLNALVFLLLPEFQMTVNTCSDDEIRPEMFTDRTVPKISHADNSHPPS